MNKYTTASAHRPGSARWLTVDDLTIYGARKRGSQASRSRAANHAHREGRLLVLCGAVGAKVGHQACTDPRRPSFTCCSADLQERQICPLCIEPLDPTEKRFFPCPCGRALPQAVLGVESAMSALSYAAAALLGQRQGFPKPSSTPSDQHLAAASRYQVCLFCFRRLKEEFSNQCPGCITVYGSDFDPGRRLRNEIKQERPGNAADVSTVPLPGALQRPPSPAVIGPSQPLPLKPVNPASEHEVFHPDTSPVRAASPAAARQNFVQVSSATKYLMA